MAAFLLCEKLPNLRGIFNGYSRKKKTEITEKFHIKYQTKSVFLEIFLICLILQFWGCVWFHININQGSEPVLKNLGDIKYILEFLDVNLLFQSSIRLRYHLFFFPLLFHRH